MSMAVFQERNISQRLFFANQSFLAVIFMRAKSFLESTMMGFASAADPAWITR
jgi:hypothetical protein